MVLFLNEFYLIKVVPVDELIFNDNCIQRLSCFFVFVSQPNFSIFLFTIKFRLHNRMGVTGPIVLIT